jgi:butyryl-CoA dehydrogenase
MLKDMAVQRRLEMTTLSAEEIKKLAEKVAKEKLGPRASEIDQNRNFPWENINELRKAGFFGVGRQVFDLVRFATAVKELAKACASTALIYVSHFIVERAIEDAGSETIKEKWSLDTLGKRGLGAFAVHEPDSGSNSAAIAARAVKDKNTYVVNGSKFFITSAGEADIYMVLVRTDQEKGLKGMSTLLIEKETPGLSFGPPENKMGLTSTSSREMFFNDCRVPLENLLGKEGEGTRVLGKTVMGWGFFGAAAIAVGIAQAATDLSIKHARERTIAGQPIGVHQAVQALITDMILESEAAEALLLECAARADSSPDTAAIHGSKAKLYASEMAVDVTNKAIQVHGGHGYCREYTVERLFRDARGLTLHFKTSEGLRQDIAKASLGL